MGSTVISDHVTLLGFAARFRETEKTGSSQKNHPFSLDRTISGKYSLTGLVNEKSGYTPGMEFGADT